VPFHVVAHEIDGALRRGSCAGVVDARDGRVDGSGEDLASRARDASADDLRAEEPKGRHAMLIQVLCGQKHHQRMA